MVKLKSSTKCKYYDKGFCKYKKDCDYLHPVETCTNQVCNTQSCSKRHPKICKYFVKGNSCIFKTKCCYRHENIAILNDELEK